MTIAYLNGTYMPLEEARISPMDRGFLFGDGIYEVVPSYGGKMVGFGPHMSRMNDGLSAIGINLHWNEDQWRELCSALLEKNGKLAPCLIGGSNNISPLSLFSFVVCCLFYCCFCC